MAIRFVLGGPPSEKDKLAIAQRRDRIKHDADPLLMRRSLRWHDHGMLPGRLSTEPPAPLPMAIRPQPTHFDRLADWYCGYLGVRDEYESTYEQQQDLKQNVPQAILRDIYRPIKEPYFEWERLDVEIDRGGQKAMAEAKKAREREPLPRIDQGLAVIKAEQRRRRRLLATPWAAKYLDSAPRRYATLESAREVEVQDEEAGSGQDSDDDE